MTKKIEVSYLGDASVLPDDALDQLPFHVINEVSWPAYPYQPEVTFSMGYTSHSLALKFQVQEKHVKARYKHDNEPVYKDSCVEFFLSFDGVHYYNFEFNSLGTALVGYGTEDRDSRVRLPIELIKTIDRKSSVMEREEGKEQQWTLQVEIPFPLFYKEAITNLKGMQARANFYKCGDDLPEPHFVSWNRIVADEPNFHLPKYFGNIEFA